MLMSIEVILAGGLTALIDAGDHDLVAKFKWHARSKKHTHYARCNVPNGRRGCVHKQYMHIMLTGWAYTDHINGNGLDNRRCNLRPATRAQNQWNLRKFAGTSQFKGVSWASDRKCWRAEITVNGRRNKLGSFVNELDAAAMYDAAARDLFGEFACLNFPRLGERSAHAASHVTAAHPSPGGAVADSARALLAAASPGRATTAGGVR